MERIRYYVYIAYSDVDNLNAGEDFFCYRLLIVCGFISVLFY